jgi:hypothetical protein
VGSSWLESGAAEGDVAQVVDYDAVLQTLLGQGMKSLYYNSGSFGFPPGVPTHTVGWIGPPDPTIRSEALPFTRPIQPPHVQNLTALTLQMWRNHLPGVIWAMPRSHWAYELDFGSRDWMPGELRKLGLNPDDLAPLTTGVALEFNWVESAEFSSFLGALLDNLSGSSDFQLAWPGRSVVCMVHHHKQLWWTTSDEAIHRELDAVASSQATPGRPAGSG